MDIKYKVYADGLEKYWSNWNYHVATKLRLYKVESGYWVLIGSCSLGYAASEDEWKFVNIGNIKQVDDANELYMAMEAMSKM